MGLLLPLVMGLLGRKSEHLPEEQLQLALADTETAIARDEAEADRNNDTLRQERIAKHRPAAAPCVPCL